MKSEALPPPAWVDTPDGLRRLIEELRRHPRVAVDTESNSLHAYRERVCLIQFSTPGSDVLVDPLALDDLSPLGEIFANANVEKVFHAAEYDLICLTRDYGFAFANLFDTMQAARILGVQAVGLDSLLSARFDIQVDKRYQKANWGERPLKLDQINYARLDTHYLLELRDLLQAELEEKGRWPLAREDFIRACRVENNHKTKSGCAWERVSGQRDLSPRQLTLLNELCLARERIAERLDRPPFRVVDDGRLLALAQAAPTSQDQLIEGGLTTLQAERFGNEFLAAIRRGQRAPLVVRTHVGRPDDAFLARLDALKLWRKRKAAGMGVESDVVLPRPILQALAERGPHNLEELAPVMESTPWRLEHYGLEILQVLRRK
jgi:ribonuclease D